MIISIASGKGGTGKTMLSTSLALAYRSVKGRRLLFLDCDVEEPNARIFLKPELTGCREVTVPVPVVDMDKCTACGLCAEVCEYNAIMVNKKGRQVLTFHHLCRGCGACSLLCPERAISEQERIVGVVEWGRANGMDFVDGSTRIGEAMAPPLIRAVKEHLEKRKDAILDCPPGTACPVVASVRGSDYCLLVTEPTPFGLNDLTLAVEMVRALGIPAGVVINQADIGDKGVRDYCRSERLSVLAEIPYDRRIAESYSRGITAFEISKEHEKLFTDLLPSVAAEEKQCLTARY
jgi:MinD superfamily P-loop ATPase